MVYERTRDSRYTQISASPGFAAIAPHITHATCHANVNIAAAACHANIIIAIAASHANLHIAVKTEIYAFGVSMLAIQ